MCGSTLNGSKYKFVHPRSNIPHNYQRRRYSAHKQYSTQLPTQTVQRTQAIFHAITNAGGTAHTSRCAIHNTCCFAYLTCYSFTALPTLPNKFLTDSCQHSAKPKIRKKHWARKLSVLDTGWLRYCSDAKENSAESKSGHFNVPKKLLGHRNIIVWKRNSPGGNGPNGNFVPRNKASDAWIYNSNLHLLTRLRRRGAIPPLNHNFRILVLKNVDKFSFYYSYRECLRIVIHSVKENDG